MKKWALCAGAFVVVVYVGILVYVQTAFDHKIVQGGELQPQKAALVLGASVMSDRTPSIILQDRLDTAYELYREKKIAYIIVSGDNRSANYNEPEGMRTYLIQKGISEKKIVADYAGRETYDSCYRAKAIFGQDALIIVTQKFHLPRALFLCHGLGIDAWGVPADAREYSKSMVLYAREYLASLKAWWKVTITRPQPVLGKQEVIR